MILKCVLWSLVTRGSLRSVSNNLSSKLLLGFPFVLDCSLSFLTCLPGPQKCDLFQVCSKVRGLFCTSNRQLDFATSVKPHEEFPDSPTAFRTATTTGVTTKAVSGGQQHQIELRAITNAVFIKPLGVVQYNVAEAQTHHTLAWLRNDCVPQEDFKAPNRIGAIQLDDLITFSSDVVDQNSEVFIVPHPRFLGRENSEAMRSRHR